ncbi:Histone-lysine N-methyltransferase ASHR3 [Dichanthelium oligosanthes]|uniref:Histone-lysine N-methyltransferase ASHR3 n=1 Tax=Dichanthelium oligosanthes TaxID=888268 RepID=A0A1E5W7V2_9POAL|nr:Histone-lysine N-methyltransferase ASHR3 [Dichanthelium oligosanthes]
MGGPPAATASTSSASPGTRRRSTRLLIDPPPRDDQGDQPTRAPSPEPASTSAQPRRRSASVIGLRRPGDQPPPPPPPPPRASTPPPPAAEEVAPPPSSGAATPRRSARVHLRVIGLPSAASISAPRRRRRRSPTAPRAKSIEEKAEEWGKEKAASGVPQEECVLPFLRKGAPRKVRTWLNESLCFVECLICSKSILPDEKMQCSVNHCDVTLHKSCSEKGDGCCPRHVSCGCVNCDRDSTCENCPCRCSLVSCSQACHCSVKCSNKPFRKEKRIEIIKTQKCGWGATALETIEKDDFVIEFVGEVIDDAMCEDRLQDMRQRRDQNIYMCKVSKDFVIDATFGGNACRFLNHSCQPNCRLEKWQVNGKTRLGVFASQTIKVGMPLTYNYRYFRLALDSLLLLVHRKNVFAGRQTVEGNCDR